MKNRCLGKRLALPLLLAAIAFATSASAVCVPTTSPVDGIAVSLMSPVSDDTHRREFAEISDDLATALGIGSVAMDDDDPNPQIRVRMYALGAGGSGLGDNNAVFTVVAIRPTGVGTDYQMWVYLRDSGTDKDAGEFKLFAEPGSNNTVVSTTDSNFDTFADGFLLSAYRIPVSRLEFTAIGGTMMPTDYYCEPSSGRSYVEKAEREDSDEMVVLAPHGGSIETDTSEQAELFADLYETYAAVPVNIWNLEGKWGSGQTDERWHITATSLDIDSESYPGLTALLPGDGTFDRAVSFHGFSVDDFRMCSGAEIEFFQIILGGGAEQNLKCAIALEVYDEADGRIAIVIRHDEEEDIEMPDYCAREVTASGRDGTSERNIVNRLASLGGIQVEQSKTIRDDEYFRAMVVDRIAYAMANYDSGYDYCGDI